MMPSDYRGVPLSGNDVNSTQSIQSCIPNEPKTSTYAKVTKQDTFPTKEQAIVMDAIDDVPLSEYIVAIRKVINLANIKFASKISMNRFCIILLIKKYCRSKSFK